jgi:hypothetical protein
MASNQEREAVKKIGKSPLWFDKVNRMSDAQVTAIYIRLKTEGKL